MRKIGGMVVIEFEDSVPLELQERMRQSTTYRGYLRERNKLRRMQRKLLQQGKPASGPETNGQYRLVLSYAEATLEELGLR